MGCKGWYTSPSGCRHLCANQERLPDGPHAVPQDYRKQGKCEGGHPRELRTFETDETRRNHKKCRCPIYAEGTLGQFRRVSTGKITWPEAKAVAAAWEAAGTWDGHLAAVTASLPTAATLNTANPDESVSIEKATAAFIKEHQENSAPNTVKKYGILMRKLKKFSASKGYVILRQWSPADVREFRGSWGVSPVTASKDISNLKAFFEFCLENKWISENPARFKARRTKRNNAAATRQKSPYTDAELQRMYDGCDAIGKTELRELPKKKSGRVVATETRYREYHRKWTGEDLADFISISAYTGLRISDVATFHITRLNDEGEIFLHAKKNDEPINTWVPEWLQERIHARAKRIGPLIFGAHTTKDMNVVTDVWRRKLKAMWEKNGPWAEKPTHHRFRHTFVRILFQDGVDVGMVAVLIGDTEEMVRKHYSKWVPERQARVRNVLKGALVGTPKPNSVKVVATKKIGTTD
ncbi:MAG TPA: tyrosine-type recombinase/integrase [Bryobacteraceae bacterium]|nr:tyrosine-type recombinase/integrase [Bryobacteraceae bacterium]